MRVIYDESRTGPFWDANTGDLDLFLKGKAEEESCPNGSRPRSGKVDSCKQFGHGPL